MHVQWAFLLFLTSPLENTASEVGRYTFHMHSTTSSYYGGGLKQELSVLIVNYNAYFSVYGTPSAVSIKSFLV